MQTRTFIVWGRRTSAALLLATVAVWPSSVGADGGFLGAIGRFLGAPLGGIVEALTTPTLRNVEGTVARTVSDVDHRIGFQIDHAGVVVKDALSASIDKTDLAAKARLSQADDIMEARIAQVDASANARIAQTIGGLKETVGQAIQGGHGLIKDLDKRTQDRLEQGDAILEARIDQVHGVVQSAIAQADQDVAARIEQLDESAEKRVGSLDVIATKQSLNLQMTLLKVGALLGMVVFLALALIHLFKHVPDKWQELLGLKPKWGNARRGAWVAASSTGWLLGHLAFGAVGVLLFVGLASWLPLGAQAQAKALIESHQTALHASLDAFDFKRVRYHAAQLAILDTDHERQHRAFEMKSQVIETIFTRPGLLASDPGIAELQRLLHQAESAYEQLGEGGSPDVLVGAAYVKWQLARTRSDELAAVHLCTAAISLAGKAQFPLRPMAEHYIRLYSARPLSMALQEDIRAVDLGGSKKGSTPDDGPPFSPLASAATFDELVLALDRNTSKVYIAMLTAQADLEHASEGMLAKSVPKIDAKQDGLTEPQLAIVNAKVARQKAAKALVEVWTQFDQQLQDKLGTDPVAIGALTLNDAPLSQALWYYAHSDALERAPVIKGEKDPLKRAQMAPVRIDWARRYVVPLGADTQPVAAFQESKRWAEHEQLAAAFQTAFVDYLVEERRRDSKDLAGKRLAAALAAARLGFYAEGTDAQMSPYGVTLLSAKGGSPNVDKEVMAAYDRARLRLL